MGCLKLSNYDEKEALGKFSEGLFLVVGKNPNSPKNRLNYHEFGQLMEGRGFKGNYRYGYQGSEKDNEVNGDGSNYTTLFRQLDSRLGRWMAPDPVFQPWQSPYTSMDNNPICLNDVLGDKAGDKDNGVDNEIKSGEGASQAYERLSSDGEGGKRFKKKEFAEANSDKKDVLQEVRERIEVIHLFMRLMKDMQQISIKQFVQINTSVENVSKQLTGWQKAFS